MGMILTTVMVVVFVSVSVVGGVLEPLSKKARKVNSELAVFPDESVPVNLRATFGVSEGGVPENV